MDSSLKSKKFGVVHTSPSEMIGSSKLEVGKLYFAQGDASGAAKQGVYALTNMVDADGVTTPQLTMFGTGAIADGNGYGLSQANFTTEEKTKLQGLSNYTLQVASDSTLGGIKTNYTQTGKNYAVKVDNSGNAYVNVPWIDKPTNASHADSATNASTAEKVANAFDISVGGSKKLTYDGSINKTLAFTGQNIGVNASTNNNVTTITIDASNLVTKSAFEASLASLEGALTYEGAIASPSELPSNLTSNDKGKVYIASTNFDYPNSTNPTHKIEAQDMFIWDGAKWNIIDGQGAVENLSAVLEYGEETSIATVDGVTIKLTMPNEVHKTSKNIVSNSSIGLSNTAATNGNVWLNHFEDSSKTSSHNIVGSGTVSVVSDASGKITITGVDTNTDTKVTSVDNHYLPNEDSSSALNANGGSNTNITGTSGKLNVITGLKRDAKGHIVGVTSANIYSTDNNDDSWRDVYVGGTQILTTGINSGSLKFVNGTNITATWNSTNKTVQFDASGLATTTQVEEAIDAAAIYWETL